MKILILIALSATLLLQGCSTLGISFNTDYGQFTYTLPQPTSSK